MIGRSFVFWRLRNLRNRAVLGAVLLFIAATSWGAMFPVAHAAFQHIDPFYFTIIRYGSVAIILMVILLWKEGLEAFRFDGKGIHLWFYGTFAFTIYNLFIFWGEDLLGKQGVMVASIMESLMPMISIIISWIVFRKSPHLFTLACVLLSFFGAVLVITKGNLQTFLRATDQLFPSLLILIAVIGWVIYTIGGSRFKDWSALRYSTFSCLLGTMTAIVITVGASLLGYLLVPSVESIKTVSPHLLFMIIFPGVIALLGWNIGVSILSPLNALLFINFVPITTLLISIFQGNEITGFDIVGTILIIISLLSNNLFVRKRSKKRETHPVHHPLQERAS